MIKRERFESFIELYESDKDIDLTWDKKERNYQSEYAQFAFSLYKDLYKYDKKYKIDTLKTLFLLLGFTFVIILTVLFINFLDSYLTSIFNIPYNSIISMLVTGFFFFIFVIFFIKFAHSMLN